MSEKKGWNIQVGDAAWGTKIFSPSGEELDMVTRLQLDLQADRLPRIVLTVLPQSFVANDVSSTQIEWKWDGSMLAHLRTDQLRKLIRGLEEELNRRKPEDPL